MKRRLNGRREPPNKISIILMLVLLVVLGRCAGMSTSETITAYKRLVNARSELIHHEPL
jgi:hypothetical protein